jgi:pyruvate dehydrogenase E1 component
LSPPAPEFTIARMTATNEPRTYAAPSAGEDDPEELRDWVDGFDAILQHKGAERAQEILEALTRRAGADRLRLPSLIQTPYVNTIPRDLEPPYPGDEQIEASIRKYIRWNAVAMVNRANANFPGIGGHLATYASAATILEVGFHHFFRGKDAGPGDQVYFQGHAAPGIYARAYLLGRLTDAQVDHFRREAAGRGAGLSSYPHPWLMPDFWEFPTVSMGLGPIAAIYQARFNRYLRDRGIRDTSNQRVWAFLGDGECDEPESLGALHLASRERLDNLVFVVNCNLQRLDGPVRGNGKIIQELEGVFRGAGWDVFKVIWSSDWDPLLAADETGHLERRMMEAVDGDYQRYSIDTHGGYIREHFFGRYPETARIAEAYTNQQLHRLRRGGHDVRKVYAAFNAACKPNGKPSVILAKTIKGYALGETTEGRNTTHQQKHLSSKEMKLFRDRLGLSIPDDKVEENPLVVLDKKSVEFQYIYENRMRLGGFTPKRIVRPKPLPPPDDAWIAPFLGDSGKTELSTTNVFARLLAQLLKHETFGKRIVPIIPDESRTFGLDALFRQFGIYSSLGQLYEPVDKNLLLYYREAKDGQVLQEGITEAGSMASFLAAGTSYSTHAEPMVPFYIFYSMFGFQRTGDQMWQFGDARGRGFLMGATAGRTTLNGEGLQHEDGHSLVHASTVPNCISYDPAYGYELAIIIREGLRRMFDAGEDVFYYITLQNESYVQPAMPPGVERGVLEGAYRLSPAPALGDSAPRARLLGSASILREALRAQGLLERTFGVAAEVWSVTSYPELRREALLAERWSRLHPEAPPRVPRAQRLLADDEHGPIIAATDYMRQLPHMISPWVPGITALGTDGFGRSDTREALRRHFEVDAESIAAAALAALARRGTFDAAKAATAVRELGLDPERLDPQYA